MYAALEMTTRALYKLKLLLPDIETGWSPYGVEL